MEKIVCIVKDLGFPVAVCLLLLYFCFYAIERNTQAIHALDKSVNRLVVVVETGLQLHGQSMLPGE